MTCVFDHFFVVHKREENITNYDAQYKQLNFNIKSA